MCSPERTFDGLWYADLRRGTPAEGGSIAAVQCGSGSDSLMAACGWSVACGQGDSIGFDAKCVCCGFVTVLAVVWFFDNI